jgi:hypothetical protein
MEYPITRLRGTFTIDLAHKYWDMANAIVAFSVLQMIAFLYALAQKEIRQGIGRMFTLVQVLILLSAVLYSAGVVGCYIAECELLRAGGVTDVSVLLRYTLVARVGVITLYSFFGVAILRFGRRNGWM